MGFFAWAAGVGAIGTGLVLGVLTLMLIAQDPWTIILPIAYTVLMAVVLRRKHAQDRANLAVAAATSDIYAERLAASRAEFAEQLHQARVAGNPMKYHDHTSLDDIEDEDEREAVHRVRMLPRTTGRRTARFWEGTDWD